MNSKLVAEWSAYNVALYTTQQPPPLGTVDTVEKLEKLARVHLTKVASEGASSGCQFSIKLNGFPGAFLYVFGSAGVCKTYEANRKAFDKWAIIPRMLRNCTARNLEVSTSFLPSRAWLTEVGPQTTIFGHKFKAPIILAPIGVQGILHPEAELGTATAARDLKIPMILSTASTRSMEEVAEVHGDGHRWYQLYW